MIATTYADFRNLFTDGSGFDVDGLAVWPVGQLIEPQGTNPTQSWTDTFPITFAISGSNDAVSGVDDWHWYLSQPNTGSGDERLELQRFDTSALVSRSGRIKIALTAAGQAEMTAYTQSSKTMRRFYANVYLYVKDVQNDEIQMFDMSRLAFAPSSLP